MFSRRSRVAVAIVALLAATSVALAQTAKDQEAMMKEWAKWSTPGEAHKNFAKMAGSWNTETKMWMDPSQPATTSKGTAVYTTIFGGRYMSQNYKGDMMGMPFEGIGTVGYDNFRQRYFSTWIDNMSTAMMLAYGSGTEKEITMAGTMDEPMTGEKDKKFREVIKITGPDTFTFEMYDTIQGKEVRVMEILHTRVK